MTNSIQSSMKKVAVLTQLNSMNHGRAIKQNITNQQRNKKLTTIEPPSEVPAFFL